MVYSSLSYPPASVGVSERSFGVNPCWLASQKDRTKKDKLIDYVCYIGFSTLPGYPNSLLPPFLLIRALAHFLEESVFFIIINRVGGLITGKERTPLLLGRLAL